MKILKFQKPLFSTEPSPQVLITDKSGDIVWFRPYQGSLRRIFGDKKKFYAECNVKQKTYVMIRMVEDQEW